MVDILFQFVTHSYVCSLAMYLCEMSTLDDVPPAFGSDIKPSVFLDKLSTNIVQFVFLEPENLDVALRACGKQMPSPVYCICRTGLQ